MDDVMSLLLLAIAAAALQTSASQGRWDFGTLSLIALKATAFFCVAIAGGRMAAPRISVWLARISVEHKMKLIVASLFFLVYMYGAERAGLEPAIGAFAAGLALEAAHFGEFRVPVLVERLRNASLPEEAQIELQRAAARHIEDLVSGPIYIFVPVFFVRTGMLVDIRALAHVAVLGTAAILFIAAVLGKLACALAVGEGVNRWIVATAMIARGEVQLLGASLGLGLGVISKETFTAIVVVVILTAFTAPVLLSALLRRFDTHPLTEATARSPV
jgi:Kef-type K+ transport system membrane component KefB